MSRASDEALMAGLAAGDTEAASALVRRYQQRVFGLAFTVLGDRHAAEDVAQEAFVRAWRHASTFDARRSSVATWLLTITRNAAIDAVRVRRSTPVDPEVLLALRLATPWRGPDELAVDATDVDRVRTAVAGLPQHQRQALLLTAFYGRTAADLAEAEGIPLGTAKTRIRTALRKVRAALVDDEVTP